MMDVKENIKNVDVWLRGLFILVFGIIFYFLCILISLVVVFQFVMRVISGSLNHNIYNLSEGLCLYAFQILNYVTFRSEERPYPFSEWPEGTQKLIEADSAKAARGDKSE